jgi:hypothetical protein
MGQEKLRQCFTEFIILHIRSNCADTIVREVDARNLCLAEAKIGQWRVGSHDASESVYMYVLRGLFYVLPSAVHMGRIQRAICLVAGMYSM